MTDRTDAILAELLEIQRQALANQRQSIENQMQALEQQRTSIARHQRVLRLAITLIVLIALAVLLPYAWQWVQFLLAQ